LIIVGQWDPAISVLNHHDSIIIFSGDLQGEEYGIMRASKRGYVGTSLAVSARMRRIGSRNTGLERAMATILRGLSIRFEQQPKLLGHPDFRVVGTRRQRELEGSAFSRNRALWRAKLVSNKLRDARFNRALRKQGWSVQRFWDTDILRSPDKVKARLIRIANDHGLDLADG
jgi:G:T-mismatch repair DNA endonuclease (very short patch repair protein)